MAKMYPKKALVTTSSDESFEVLYKMYLENEALELNHTNALKKYFMEDWLSIHISFKKLDYRNHSKIKCPHFLVKLEDELICPFCLATTKNFNFKEEELDFLIMAAKRRNIYIGEVSTYNFPALKQFAENYIADYLETVKQRDYMKERISLLSKLTSEGELRINLEGEIKELTKKKTIN